MSNNTLFIAADHAGVSLKDNLKSFLEDQNIPVKDLGTFEEASVDYPDFAFELSKAISGNNDDKGILICGSGVGMSIAANRYKHIRAALCHDTETARLAREHNDANVLALGARTISPEIAKSIVETFLDTEFSGGRHERRVEKLSNPS